MKPLSFATAPVPPDTQTRELSGAVLSLCVANIIGCDAASSRLAELAGQLTPAQAQTIDHLLHSVKQLSSANPALPTLPTLPTLSHTAQVGLLSRDI